MRVLDTFVCVYAWACVQASYRRLSSLCYWGFYVVFSIVIEILCTGSRRSSRWGLCRRWLHRGLSLWQSPVRPVRYVDLFEPSTTALLCGRYFVNILSCIKTPVIRFICMLGNLLLWFFLTHAVIYVYIYILTVLAKFYDICNPEILCHCVFYLSFTCTLSEMMNKRCRINHQYSFGNTFLTCWNV